MNNRILFNIIFLVATLSNISNMGQPSQKVIKSNMHISECPCLDVHLWYFKQCEKLGLDNNVIVSLKDTKENLLEAKNKYGIDCFMDDNLIKTPYNNSKIVFYISTVKGIYDDMSVKEYYRYRDNNILRLKFDCELNRKQSTSIIKHFFKERGHYRCCTLLSDNYKLIDIYVSLKRSDWMHFYTSHQTPIAILIDETGKIIHILDNVKSEQDIFNAFGI